MLGYGIMKGHFMSSMALETSQKILDNVDHDPVLDGSMDGWKLKKKFP